MAHVSFAAVRTPWFEHVQSMISVWCGRLVKTPSRQCLPRERFPAVNHCQLQRLSPRLLELIITISSDLRMSIKRTTKIKKQIENCRRILAGVRPTVFGRGGEHLVTTVRCTRFNHTIPCVVLHLQTTKCFCWLVYSPARCGSTLRTISTSKID